MNGMGIREAPGATLRVDTPIDKKGNVCYMTHNEETVQMVI
jgi:hypothetical protein